MQTRQRIFKSADIFYLHSMSFYTFTLDKIRKLDISHAFLPLNIAKFSILKKQSNLAHCADCVTPIANISEVAFGPVLWPRTDQCIRLPA